MAFPPGWDRFDRWTLRFVEPDLERAYQHADHAAGARRVRTTSFVAIGAWVLVALIGPPVVGVTPGPTWLICAVMIVTLLVSAGVGQWATTQRRRDAIGMGQQLAAITRTGACLLAAWADDNEHRREAMTRGS